MSGALLRRNSSKQGLQNLLRVTAQRSIEDAEEIERERRRRAREAFRREHGLSAPDGASLDALDAEASVEATPSAQNFTSSAKATGSVVLDEDEGFSDWTQRLGQERRLRLENGRPAEATAERGMNGTAKHTEKIHCSSSSVTPARLQRLPPREKENRDAAREEKVEEETRLGSRATEKRRKEFGKKEHSQTEREVEQNGKDTRMSPFKKGAESQAADMDEKMKKKEVKVSYTSKVLMQHEPKPRNNKEEEETASHVIRARKTLRSPSQSQPATAMTMAASEPRDEEAAAAFLETEQKLEKIRRSHQEKESQELEQLRQKQAEAEAELEELKKRRELRRRVREEEERRREEEEQHRLAKEEEEKRHMKEEIERRRMEAAEKRMKSLNDGEEPFNALSPKSPTVKITERTESLNRSLKKSNSFKKTPPPLLLSKIDDKLEQYTHAVEVSSKETKPAKAAAMDVLSPPKPVASTKSLFEAGEAWSPSAPRGQPSKETEGIKVGVADLITNWVKGSVDGSNRNSPSRPADVKPGDVLQKKNLWEVIGENSSSGKPGSGGKGNPSGKRYKFIVTGHGKYEKIPVDDEEDYCDFSNGKTGELCHDDF
ncbi:non-muscle caldesmon isoform X2 [Sardina pilchardus]|uniref:non-muscle caldesmon isoform X2 n=1 Tax=Sardina pilchardus TaxID=27697 RepID=UPI002E14685D